MRNPFFNILPGRAGCISVAAWLSLAALPAPASQVKQSKPNRAAASAAVKIQTLRVQETLLTFDPAHADSTVPSHADPTAGAFHPFIQSEVIIQEPDRMLASVRHGSDPKPVYLFVTDGKTTYSYNSTGATYYKQGAQEPASDPFAANVVDITQIALLEGILDGKPPAAGAGATRVVTADVLDGKAMTLTTDTSPGGRSRWWVDAKTRLPYRMITETRTGGVLIPQERRDFSGWQINAPVAAARFTWTPPPGAAWANKPKFFDYSLL